MDTEQQLSSVMFAPKRGSGRPAAHERDVLSRQVAFEFCRMGIPGAETVTDVVAAIDPDDCIYDKDEKRRIISRMWHHAANGVYNFSADQLAKMEAKAPGTTAILTQTHACLRLLADEPPSRAELVEAIRRLPNAFVDLLLTSPDPRTGYVGVQPIGDYELFGVQSLGSLDAVAALLAASHLCEEIGFTDGMLNTARAGIRLFLRIALSGPFSHYLPRIWPFMERRYVSRLSLLELRPYQRIQEDYRLVLDTGGKLTIFGLTENEHLSFLLLADRWYFGNIVFLLKQVAPKLDNDKRWPFEQYPGALQALVVGHEDFPNHQMDQQLNSDPYPKESLEKFEQSMRRELPKFSEIEEGAMYEAYDYD